MAAKGVTQYQLLKAGIDNHTLDSLKKGRNISMPCTVGDMGKGVRRVERAVRFAVCSSGASAFPASFEEMKPALPALFDRMTEGVYASLDDIFDRKEPARGVEFDVLGRGVEAVREANTSLGLAISEEEMEYLAKSFKAAGRNPTDTELVMFGQVNSITILLYLLFESLTIRTRDGARSSYGQGPMAEIFFWVGAK